MGTGWWVADVWHSASGPVKLVSWVVWVIVSIVLHELAHGWAALRRGDTTPRDTGHMTWNPLVHMGQMSLIVFAVIGIAWGAMPVDPSRMRGRYADTFVAAAGPATNLLLAIGALVLGGLWLGLAGSVPDPLRANLFIFFFIGAMLNVVLMLLNLLPVPPLDGGRIAADLFPAYRRMFETPNGQWVALGALLLIFFIGGRYLFDVGIIVANLGIEILGALIDTLTGMGIPTDALPAF